MHQHKDFIGLQRQSSIQEAKLFVANYIGIPLKILNLVFTPLKIYSTLHQVALCARTRLHPNLMRSHTRAKTSQPRLTILQQVLLFQSRAVGLAQQWSAIWQPVAMHLSV